MLRAGQEELNENPAPASVQEQAAPIESGFKERPVARNLNAISDWLRKELQNAPPFVRDTQLTLKPRTYYYDQQTPDGRRKEAWAAGGSLEYKSGWLAEHFRVGGELYTSQPVYAPAGHGGTLLLEPDQSGYTVLGQAYGELKFSDDELLTAGRREYNTPYINPQFNRMTPNTFEGVTLKGSYLGLLTQTKFSYLVGYLSKIKPRNSDEFVPMSEPVGLSTSDNGTYFAHLLFDAWGAAIGLAEYFTPNNLNIFYAEAAYTPKLSGNVGVKLSAQYTGERTVAENFSVSGEPLSRNAGARTAFSYEQSVLTVAFSKTASSGQVISPWGSNPSYTNGAIRNTNRPDERGALVSYSYDFSKVGVPGLSVVGLYSYSWGALDASTGQPLNNDKELDLGVDYRVQTGVFRGLSFRLQRNVLTGVGDPEATKEWRVILNWQIPLM